MDGLPLNLLILICEHYHITGDLRTLTLVNRSFNIAARIVMDRITVKERRLIKFIDQWQAKCSGTLAVAGWPCVLRNFGFPYKITCPIIDVYHLGAGTEDIPHPTQDGVLMPMFADIVDNTGIDWKFYPVVPGIRLARRVTAIVIADFLCSMPLSTLCYGYTNPSNIIYAPFSHVDAPGDPQTCYLNPNLNATLILRDFEDSITAARLLGFSVKIPASGESAEKMIPPLTYLT